MPRGPAVGVGDIHGAEVTVSRPLSVPRGARPPSRVLRGDAKGRGGAGRGRRSPGSPVGRSESRPRPSGAAPYLPGLEAEPAGSAGPGADPGM